MDDAAVDAAHPDHLAEIVAPDHLLVAGQLADRDRHGDGQRDQPDDQQIGEDLQRGEEDPLDAGRSCRGHRGLAIGGASHGRKMKRRTA
jgi:hypothetical protein